MSGVTWGPFWAVRKTLRDRRNVDVAAQILITGGRGVNCFCMQSPRPARRRARSATFERREFVEQRIRTRMLVMGKERRQRICETEVRRRYFETRVGTVDSILTRAFIAQPRPLLDGLYSSFSFRPRPRPSPACWLPMCLRRWVREVQGTVTSPSVMTIAPVTGSMVPVPVYINCSGGVAVRLRRWILIRNRF